VRTNLIQSYLNNQQIKQKYGSDNTVKNFDVQKELSNRTFIKPLPSNGKLIRPNIFDMPSEMAKGVIYDWNSLRHAIKGNANDHELGRLNDVGMKLGGLAIATYLFTRKQTPMTKIFEFLGFASFFGAMDLWPKLFLQLPAKLIHGVNVRQKYEDNYGRKKMFYSDPQFIPWDLYSDKEIDKIGNRLHVPKDIPNRRDFIQEKMRKIALQNNTMWMLSSGFATPLMSALICNRLEAPVAKYLHGKKREQAELLLTNFSQEIKKSDFSQKQQNLNLLLEENQGKVLTEDLFNEIIKNITQGQDPKLVKAVKSDLQAQMPIGEHFTLTRENLESVQNVLNKTLKSTGLSDYDIAKLVPTREELVKAFEDKGLFGNDLKEFSNQSKLVQSLLDGKVSAFEENGATPEQIKKIKFAINKMVHQPKKGMPSPLEVAFRQQPSKILTVEMAETLKSVSSTLENFKAKTNVLNKYSYTEVAQAQETILADIWNKTSEGFLKALKLTPEEISKARLDGEIAGDVLRAKLENIVSDKQSCGEFVTKIEKLLSEMYSGTEGLERQDNLYKELVNSTFGECADALKGKGLKGSVEALVGYDNSARTSLKGVYLNFVADRITGVKSSFYRLLQSIDTYYKIAHLEGLEKVLRDDLPRVVKEEMVELAKTTLLNAHTSDFAEKLYQRRQPIYGICDGNTDFSQIEVEGGKVKNRYFGKKLPSELVPQPNDRTFFSDVMKLMFGGDIHPDIAEKIKSSGFFADFTAYREDIINKLGCERNFAFPNVVVDDRVVQASSNERFNRLGCATNDMLHKLANNKYNSKKWFSKFGKLGIAVAGITVASQFFMGRMKNPQKTGEVK
jgi:hypothetical protein